MWVLLFMLTGPAFQQVHAQTAGLSGTVTDTPGASNTGVIDAFRNEATGTTAQFATASDGVYSAQIDKGTWDITVQAKGFQKFEATHVAIEVGAMPDLCQQTFIWRSRLFNTRALAKVVAIGSSLNHSQPTWRQSNAR